MISNPSLFSAADYVRYRFSYPESLFEPLKSYLSPAGRSQLSVLDLGCGTGLVAESFSEFYPSLKSFYLVEPDGEMLDQARERLQNRSEFKTFLNGFADAIPLDDESMDLVLIGSAWHWMPALSALAEIDRVLRPGGLVYIFEYQFPKAREVPALNDWIRQQFNLKWKPSTQQPRGSLAELTQCWRNHFHFSQIYSGMIQKDRNHDARELVGVIASQSRYQHFEQSLSDEEKEHSREELLASVRERIGEKPVKFHYEYQGFLFKKRV